MDSDDVVTIDDDDNDDNSDDGDYKVTDRRSQPIKNVTRDYKMSSVGDQPVFFDDSGDGNYEGIYDDLDISVNEYINEDNVYSGEEDDFAIDENQLRQDAPALKGKAQERMRGTGSVHQSEKDVDEVIVNSHLQEIVDIKNQIQELQDILHDKSSGSGNNRSKYQDVGETSEVKQNTPSKGVSLRRGLFLKDNVEKKFGTKSRSADPFKRKVAKMSLYSERLEDRIVSSSFEKKKKLKRNEAAEDEIMGGGGTSGSVGGPGPGFLGFLPGMQKKKTLPSEVVKPRSEKKTRAEDALSEDTIDAKLQEIENIPPSVTSSLRKILQMTAHTPEEKYKVLDARDKLYKIMRDKEPVAKTKALMGTCPDMCPEKERLQREFQFQVSMFEMVNYPKNTTLNHKYAVKQYCRSSADQEEPLPHELRPVNVLSMAMSYLLHNVADHCELSDDNIGEWYMFMWDRTRAIRKELTQQGACSLDTVRLVEQCARFHIHCAERLVDQDISVYDDKINTENLTKCIQTLKYMYRDLANEDVYCSNEPEFVCYSLLLNLKNSSIFAELSDTSERLLSSEPVRFAMDVMSAWESRNYVKFFNLVKTATYLNSCILRRYFNEMRLYATKTMIRSYCTKFQSPQISIYRFVDNLSFDNVQDCCDFFTSCNFTLQYQGDGKDSIVVNFNRMSFRLPDAPLPPSRSNVIIEEKKKEPFSVIMAGGELPPKTYEDHIPQDSFSPMGELKLDSLLCKDLMDFASAPPQTVAVTTTATAMATQPVKLKLFDSKMPETIIKPKEPSVYTDIFGKQVEFAGQEAKELGEEKSVFAKLDPKTTPPTTIANVLGGAGTGPSICGEAPSIFGQSKTEELKTTNIFVSTEETTKEGNISGLSAQKSIFSRSEGLATTNIFGKSVGGGAAPSPFVLQTKLEPAPTFKLKVPTPTEDVKVSEEAVEEDERKDKLEVEEEERLRSILMGAVTKAKEESERREKERREAKAIEEEERKRNEMKKKAAADEAEEERIQREETEAERLKVEEDRKRAEEVARLEEAKRKSDEDLKLQIDRKMLELRRKYLDWKVREIFNKWRLRTWVTVEEKKMREFFRESHVKYPPVCTEEDLMGNPYGLIIPNVLVVQKCQKVPREGQGCGRSRAGVHSLPFTPVDVRNVVAKRLEVRAKRMYYAFFSCGELGFNANEGATQELSTRTHFSELSVLDPQHIVKIIAPVFDRLFNKIDPFPWKVVFSVPGSEESDSWKDIETFIEMNFVDNYEWRFGKDKGPLYYREGSHSAFRYQLSVRRVRGVDLFEGDAINVPGATRGCNALIFVTSEDGDMDVAKRRLKRVLESRAPLPQIPVIVLLLGDDDGAIADALENRLDLKSWTDTHVSEYRIVRTAGENKDDLDAQLVQCLELAADSSSSVPLLRMVPLSDFCSTNWFELVWRRIETSLANYKVVLKDPNFLIDCYNSSADELFRIFTDPDDDQYEILGDEFGDRASMPRPTRTESYATCLCDTFAELKLPPWPREIPKSSHQLKYRIHQYARKVTGGERRRMRELKWTLYGIIRRSLLWKGLDIYCDEDIDNILLSFPWIQLFQELSRFVVQAVIQKIRSRCGGGVAEEPTVLYRLSRIEDFSYESSLISNFLKKRKTKIRRSMLEETQSVPRLEHDSVLVAYSTSLLEHESNKRKRDEIEEDAGNSDEGNGLADLFKWAEAKKQMLDKEEEEDAESGVGKSSGISGDERRRRTDVSRLRDNFQNLSDRLDDLKSRMEENAKILMELEGY